MNARGAEERAHPRWPQALEPIRVARGDARPRTRRGASPACAAVGSSSAARSAAPTPSPPATCCRHRRLRALLLATADVLFRRRTRGATERRARGRMAAFEVPRACTLGHKPMLSDYQLHVPGVSGEFQLGRISYSGAEHRYAFRTPSLRNLSPSPVRHAQRPHPDVGSARWASIRKSAAAGPLRTHLRAAHHQRPPGARIAVGREALTPLRQVSVNSELNEIVGARSTVRSTVGPRACRAARKPGGR